MQNDIQHIPNNPNSKAPLAKCPESNKSLILQPKRKIQETEHIISIPFFINITQV